LSFFQSVANLKNNNEAIKTQKITAYHKGRSILSKNDVRANLEPGDI
jgi:uncharacterized protein involved in tellurium resistance